MMTSAAMICETESMLNDQDFVGLELESEFGVTNQEGENSNPSFSTDVSDEEDFSSGDEDDLENGKKRKHDDGGGPKTRDQLDRRRERNRVLARKTRLRKKSFFEALQKQVAQLAVENDMLKGIVRQRLGGSKSASQVQNAPLNSAQIAHSNNRASAILENADHSLMMAIQAAQRSYIISDPALPDNPIIFASKGFLDLSGYSLENILGRNCNFLQGPGTDSVQVEVLREGIKAGRDTSVCLLNYRADGTPFFNQVFIAAIRDKQSNNITNYVGVQVEMKSLLDPHSSIDIEDLGLNKVPKKGRPRTRELKEPRPPKVKEQKQKVACLTKAQQQKISHKLSLSNPTSSSSSEKHHTGGDNSGGMEQERDMESNMDWQRDQDERALRNIILNIPSLELNSPPKKKVLGIGGDVYVKTEGSPREYNTVSNSDSRCAYSMGGGAGACGSELSSSLSGLRGYSVYNTCTASVSSSPSPASYVVHDDRSRSPASEHGQEGASHGDGGLSSGSQSRSVVLSSHSPSHEDLAGLVRAGRGCYSATTSNGVPLHHGSGADGGVESCVSYHAASNSHIKTNQSNDILQVIDDLFSVFDRDYETPGHCDYAYQFEGESHFQVQHQYQPSDVTGTSTLCVSGVGVGVCEGSNVPTDSWNF